jgi:ribosomal protein S12 methylthiotransferase accessory factor
MPISGVPSDLPNPARRYAEALPKGQYTSFPLTSLDRTGVAVWEVSLFLDNSEDFPGAMPSGYGYGTTDGEVT